MKLRHLLLAVGAAHLAYQAVKHRKEIAAEAKETKELIQRIQADKQKITDQLALLNSFKAPVQELSKDLQYQLKVYQQSITGNLTEIQKFTDKYKTEDSQHGERE
ncbi:chemotaxis protein [Streptococcus suis]